MDFLVATLANTLGTLLAALVVYHAIDRQLHLTERRDREERERQREARQREQEQARREEISRDVLTMIDAELLFNDNKAEVLLHRLTEETIPYPGFSTNGWQLLSQITAFTSIRADTLKALVLTYNRLRSASRIYEQIYDFAHGATSVHVFLAGQVPPLELNQN